MDDVISFEHVFKRIGQREILKDINLAVKQGDIFGFLGPNGAGKTTPRSCPQRVSWASQGTLVASAMTS